MPPYRNIYNYFFFIVKGPLKDSVGCKMQKALTGGVSILV